MRLVYRVVFFDKSCQIYENKKEAIPTGTASYSFQPKWLIYIGFVDYIIPPIPPPIPP